MDALIRLLAPFVEGYNKEGSRSVAKMPTPFLVGGWNFVALFYLDALLNGNG